MSPSGPPRAQFRQVGERLIHQGYIMGLVEGTFVAPDGAEFTRDIIRHPGAVGVVALDGEDVVLVRQYRPVFAAELLEIPAGTRDRDGEDPQATAVRELAEEVGATASAWEHLSTYWVAPGVSDEQMHLYLATGLTFGARAADGPEEEAMSVERIPLARVERLVDGGEIVDAKSIIGLLLVARRFIGEAGGRQ